MTAFGREAAIASEDERRSAKHHFRPNTGLSSSSNEAAETAMHDPPDGDL